jgi:tRNA dimethylallyltransferase
MNKTLIVVLGPTGIGKTNVAIRIGLELDTEIISADSRQIYKELRIGTAVPFDDQLKTIKHHFIGNKSLFDYYNVSIYELEVLELLEQLFLKKNQAVLVGGSGLYIDAVCKGIDDLPSADPEIRNKLKEQYTREGINSLRLQLKYLDPEYYKTVDLKNPKRLIRALETSIITGKPYSTLITKKNKPRNFKIFKIGLIRDRNELYEQINRRVDFMIESGLVEEADRFFQHRNLNSLNTVGYRELFEYFEGKISLEKAIELIKRNSRRYAKRQLSWFARDKEIQWFHPEEIDKIISFINKKL